MAAARPRPAVAVLTRVRAVTRIVSENALLVEFPEESAADANCSAVTLAERFRAERVRGVLELVSGARTLFVVFDPGAIGRETLARRLRSSAELAGRGGVSAESRLFRLPVAYGGEGGPDLELLARERGLAPDELARRHSAAEYRVSFLGFSPGFAYLTGLPEELAALRLSTPRPRIAAGSVGIGGEYTAVYPSESPGGWNLVGRTAACLFDPADDPPALLKPGDRVRFDPIGAEELARQLGRRRAEDAERAAAPSQISDPLFELISPGLATSIQGGPRYGLASSGVPAGGAMDPESLARGNAAVGNPAGAAALEVTLSGPEVGVLRDAVVCVSGADFDLRRNGRPTDLERPFEARAGDRLSFGSARSGARAYLCVAGGLARPRPAEPAPRLARRAIVGGEAPAARTASKESGSKPPAPVRPPPDSGSETILRVLPGAQADRFDPAAAGLFYASTYRVSPESDRRGIRLDGPALPASGSSDVPPEGTALGAIQIPGGGLPIVLGPDRPVTGGYAKIGTVAARDWPLLAQAPPGAAVRFLRADVADVEADVD